MGKLKNLNIKNQTYYYFNDIINIKDFHSILLKIDKKQYIDTYYIGYITVLFIYYIHLAAYTTLQYYIGYSTLIFTILATLLLKKLVIVKILTVLIHCI